MPLHGLPTIRPGLASLHANDAKLHTTVAWDDRTDQIGVPASKSPKNKEPVRFSSSSPWCRLIHASDMSIISGPGASLDTGGSASAPRHTGHGTAGRMTKRCVTVISKWSTKRGDGRRDLLHPLDDHESDIVGRPAEVQEVCPDGVEDLGGRLMFDLPQLLFEPLRVVIVGGVSVLHQAVRVQQEDIACA